MLKNTLLKREFIVAISDFISMWRCKDQFQRGYELKLMKDFKKKTIF